jgi:hypothetical protein
MTRQLKDPLRSLAETERQALETLSRSTSTPAAQVMRAKLLLAVADGMNYTEAAHSVDGAAMMRSQPWSVASIRSDWKRSSPVMAVGSRFNMEKPKNNAFCERFNEHRCGIPNMLCNSPLNITTLKPLSKENKNRTSVLG